MATSSEIDTGSSGDNKKQKALRIGILGVASISHKNAIAIQNPASGCSVTAIASRSLEKAESFVKQHCLDADVVIMGGESAYDELIRSEGIVDALYIPLPTSLHKEWATKALLSKKHILLEKPVCLDAHDFRSVLQTAKLHSKYVQDGTMFVHSKRTKKFLERISCDETFGEIRRMDATFTFCGDDDFFTNNIRASSSGDPLGCIGDLGWYCARMSILVFGALGEGKVQSAQVVHFELNEEGVPVDVSCLVVFDQDRIASFHCSFKHALTQTVTVCGTKRNVTMNDFVIPPKGTNSFHIQKQSLTDFDKYSVQENDTICHESVQDQEVLMWEDFARISRGVDTSVLDKQDAHGIGWGKSEISVEAMENSSISMQTQIIVDALMDSVRDNGKKIVLK